ncbi:TetR family transcriptional regulator C-terminal domain-containing protein [Streptomyces sp. LHD-70]|uniref:TetR family transcriptional regulator C-terminal domain-containing protein n=1 Tax=Streptomyces sp. LHD-70 TaxID=3072140 RepID=UPI00280DE6EF|nr:TetR family transcriptional regulator C-terminal domain-containing protein [Streptomyces sp. LHD-70]MDQ8706412.1 TetR family transcriptional regulator C-terminal domain-containing protein [Streptomyces sp. LHD-70]
MQQEPGSRVGDTGGEVAERVRQVIAAVGVSQREFARRIVMDPSKLSRSLSGARRFTVAELARVADTGDVDAAWLLGSGGQPDQAATGRATARPRRTTGPAPEDGGRPLQIVRETVRLIAERGFHAVRVADIAEACATSTAAIHYHFPGRDDLLEAAVRWCMDEDTARRAAHIAEAADVAGELRQLIELQTPDTRRQRRQWSVWLDLWAEAARSTVVGRLHVEYYRQWRETVADVIRRGVAAGAFRPVDPEAAALTLTALIDGLASQVLATTPGEPGTSADDMRRALLAHVETSLAAR